MREQGDELFETDLADLDLDIVVGDNDPPVANEQCFGSVRADRDARRDRKPGAVKHLIGNLYAACVLPVQAIAAVKIDQTADKPALFAGVDLAGWR